MYRCVTGLAGLRGSAGEWAERFQKVCDELLRVPPDLRGESAVQSSLAEAFEDLKIYDSLGTGSPGEEGGEPCFDIKIIREFVTSRLGSISGGYEDYLTDGVTISALQPMRPIPFRVVYVLGMEEGAFPGRADASSLDLRLRKRRIGDVSIPERNRYLFLEMLLSVRHRLYIGYVARDLQKDRVMQPCSVVNQLRRYVEEEILLKGERFRVTEVPLKGTSQRYVSTDAVNPVSDVLVNYSLADRIACYQENDLWKAAAETVPDALRQRLQACFPDFGVDGEHSRKDDRAVEKIIARHLRMFLEDPVSQCLKRHLGITEEEASLRETALKEDEPFYSEFPLAYHLRMAPLRLWLDRFAASGVPVMDLHPLDELCDRVYEDLRRKSATPEGAFARLDRKALKEDVFLRAGPLSRLMAEMASAEEPYRAFFVGEGTGESISLDNRLPVERFEPVRLMVDVADDPGLTLQTPVEVHGQLPWVWKDSEAKWHALVLTGSGRKPGAVPDRYILEPLLSWLCCLSTQRGRRMLEGADITFHVAYRETLKAWTYCLAPDAAGAYLTLLVSAYLDRNRPAWLPFEAVTSQTVKPHL
ncbi:MAG TPA: hypothetical protein ENO25_03090, partial [Desulfobacteraceae bacterium]|nr:hypothetical protein [Desulfobacteraceae bacterium]